MGAEVKRRKYMTMMMLMMMMVLMVLMMGDGDNDDDDSDDGDDFFECWSIFYIVIGLLSLQNKFLDIESPKIEDLTKFF